MKEPGRRAWAGVHVIADAGGRARGARSPLEIAQGALAGGAGIIQVRFKGGTARALYEEAVRVANAVRESPGARLVVNDRLDVAIAVGADAVHLGQDDLSPGDAARAVAAAGFPLALGLSTHDVAEARRAEDAGAAYIGLGPLFPTKTKGDALPARGLEILREVCEAVDVPVIAIGGIDRAGAEAALAAGAAGVAVISAVASAPDMTLATRALVALFARQG